MESQRGLFAEIFHRRIPQIVGLYVAGVWMSIEIGDWVAGQFDLPAYITSFTFILMAVFLPAVILLAWTYGAPGRDSGSTSKRVFVGLNLATAIALATYSVSGREQQRDLQLADIPVPAPVQAAASQSHRLLAFFWRSNLPDEKSWMGYGIPFLIGEDLDRASPAFVSTTPFSSPSVVERLKRDGFPTAVGEPLAIQLQTAQRGQYRYFLRGSIDADAKTPGEMAVSFYLHDGNTGAVLLQDTIVSSVDDPLSVADRVSAQLQPLLAQNFSTPPVITDLPVTETVTDSSAAFAAYTRGRIANDIVSDFEGSLSAMNEATQIDPTFAEAHGYKGVLLFLRGQRVPALSALDEALKYDYRLSTESKYSLRINKLTVGGDFKGALDAALLWTQVEPTNERAFTALFQLHAIGGEDLDQAVAALERVRVLNPLAQDTLIAQADIELQRGNYEKARLALEAYTRERPDSLSAQIKLAQAHMAELHYDKALAIFERASIIDSRSIEPEIGAVSVIVRQGDFAHAADRLASLQSRDLTPMQTVKVTQTLAEIDFLRGRYRSGVAHLNSLEPVVNQMLPPLLLAVQFHAPAIAWEGYFDSDVDAIIAKLELISDDLQPPWNDVISLYQLNVYELYDRETEFLAKLPDAERFLISQDNPTVRLLLLLARTRAALYSDDPAQALTHANAALKALSSSFINVASSSSAFLMRAGIYDMLREAGEVGEAIAGLREITKAFPSLGLAHFYLAKSYFDNGDIDRARKSLAKAAAIWSQAEPDYLYLPKIDELRDKLNGAA